MSDNDRLAALEQRVAELERRCGSRPAGDPPARTPDTEVFWALEGLLARAGDPGAVLLTGHATLPDGRQARWQEAAGVEDLLGSDWTAHVAALAALAHPARIRILQRLLHGAGTAADLVQIDGMGTSGQVYHHLRQLVAAGWLHTTGGGRHEVPAARVIPLLALLLGTRR
ncbi:transcriptional regulator [Actinoplanes philippinensis]|uniref:Helix-turn-helix domain-containing protein n=1 Tax=Actinoplanes philippinensis TaxID=35752 RepID=A0A1I2EBP7_9ACTN|nr:winged helix-turn-helix domain-containing protein [Actinoplanes philippinensis]GIE77104.1 transcriptional regulator [Actinoplanes philippinensis]SFE90444.1 Helix-turn-helix domain-containing protein [Actinoplanes philippinensis]